MGKIMAKLWQKSGGKRKKGLADSTKPLILLVRPARLERAAYGFEVRRSIQLSYGRMQKFRELYHSVQFPYFNMG